MITPTMKIAAAIAVFCFALFGVGCDFNNPQKPWTNRLGGYDDVKKFTYESHGYILFGAGPSSNIVHDPDCSCFNRWMGKIKL